MIRFLAHRGSRAIWFLLFPALFSLFPLEAVGLNGVLLQRLPVILENGVPYLDLFVLPVVFAFVLQIFKGQGSLRCYFLVLPQLLIALIYWFFSSGLNANQAFGLFLGFSAVAAYSFALRAEGIEQIRYTLEKVMFYQTWFSVLLALVLVGHTAGWLSYADEFLVLIDRFDGEGLRVRWEAVRLVDRMVVCSSAAWATYKVISERKIIYSIVPLVFVAYQLTQSSRGGVVLVLVAVVIAAVIFPADRLTTRVQTKISSVLFMLVVVVGLGGIALSTESGQALVGSVGEISDDESIRARMSRAAMDLISNNPIFGNGYFDIHSAPEWAPFVLQNMLLPLHNVFLHYLVYVGIVGSFFFIALLTLVLRDVFFIYVSKSKSIESPVRQEIAGICLATLVGGFYLLVFQTMDRVSWLYFWAFCGLLYFLRLTVRR